MQITSSITVFLVSIIGSVLIFSHKLRTHSMLLALFVTFIALMTTKFSLSPLIAWIFIGLSRVMVELFQRGNQKKIQWTLEKQIQLIDELLLMMKTGSSVRWSLVHMSKNAGEVDKKDFELILKHFQHTSEASFPDVESKKWIERLKKIALSDHKIIERLENWRFEMKLKQEFRQRSRQASLQARLQIYFCLALLVPALLWNVFLEGWSPWRRELVAIVLFLLAVLCMKKIMESFRWKT